MNQVIILNLTREDLCLIQQSLGLREMTIINSSYDLSPEQVEARKKVYKLRAKIQSEIRCLDKYGHNEKIYD
jgi:hypothetical protein